MAVPAGAKPGRRRPRDHVWLDELPAVWLDGDLRVLIAHTRAARRRGLAGLRGIDPDDALLLPRCRSIHTFGMKFAIDVLFVDADGRPLRIATNVPSRRLLVCRRARATLETIAGRGRWFARSLRIAADRVEESPSCLSLVTRRPS